MLWPSRVCTGCVRRRLHVLQIEPRLARPFCGRAASSRFARPGRRPAAARHVELVRLRLIYVWVFPTRHRIGSAGIRRSLVLVPSALLQSWVDHGFLS
jgi:hypothetical protein